MSTRFNPEQPTLSMVVEKNGLRCADAFSAEALDQIHYGTAVEVKFYQRRSNQRLKLYWSILGMCVANNDDYGRAENLHDVVKIALGYCRRVKAIGVGPAAKIIENSTAMLRCLWKVVNGISKDTLGAVDCTPAMVGIETVARQMEELKKMVGDTIVLPGSISFSKMSESDFKVFFDKAMLQLETAGYPISDFLKEIERRQKQNPSYSSGAKTNGRSQETKDRDRSPQGEGATGEEESKAAA